MSYESIRDIYGIDVSVGAWVQSLITGRFGKVQPEQETSLDYVQVHFEGDRFNSPCHPEELDYEVVGLKVGFA